MSAKIPAGTLGHNGRRCDAVTLHQRQYDVMCTLGGCQEKYINVCPYLCCIVFCSLESHLASFRVHVRF